MKDPDRAAPPLASTPDRIADADAERRATIATLTREMEDAAAARDFERARRLRDQLNLLRGGATVAAALSADTSGLERQQPGRMGLGTSQQRMTPPEGWRPPPKPDPMTRATSRARLKEDPS